MYFAALRSWHQTVGIVRAGCPLPCSSQMLLLQWVVQVHGLGTSPKLCTFLAQVFVSQINKKLTKKMIAILKLLWVVQLYLPSSQFICFPIMEIYPSPSWRAAKGGGFSCPSSSIHCHEWAEDLGCEWYSGCERCTGLVWTCRQQSVITAHFGR